MTYALPPLRERALLWFGVFGAAGAWTAEHVAGYAITQAACSPAGTAWGLSLDAMVIVVTAVTTMVALLSEGAAIWTFLRTRDAGEEPPASRIHFLAIVGMAIGPLFLMMILMSGFGAVFLLDCVQG